MSPYEWALLVFSALMVCILVWDNVRLRSRIERIEADVDWLKVALKNTIKVHQKTMDIHTKGIKDLNEAHEKFAKRVQFYMDQTPSYGRLAARVDRLMKADANRALYGEKQLEKAFEGEVPPGTDEPF